jgi:hypothetical protein
MSTKIVRNRKEEKSISSSDVEIRRGMEERDETVQ